MHQVIRDNDAKGNKLGLSALACSDINIVQHLVCNSIFRCFNSGSSPVTSRISRRATWEKAAGGDEETVAKAAELMSSDTEVCSCGIVDGIGQ